MDSGREERRETAGKQPGVGTSKDPGESAEDKADMNRTCRINRWTDGEKVSRGGLASILVRRPSIGGRIARNSGTAMRESSGERGDPPPSYMQSKKKGKKKQRKQKKRKRFWLQFSIKHVNAPNLPNALQHI